MAPIIYLPRSTHIAYTSDRAVCRMVLAQHYSCILPEAVPEYKQTALLYHHVRCPVGRGGGQDTDMIHFTAGL